MRSRLRNLIIVTAGVWCLAGVGAALASASDGPGTLYTVAGGGDQVASNTGVQPTMAALGGASGVAVNAAGDVALVDAQRNVIDLIPSSDCAKNCTLGLTHLHQGMLQAVIGLGSKRVPVGGEPVSKASLAGMQTATFDAAGDLAVPEYYHDQIDLVANRSCASNCPFGRAKLQKGYVYRVAGGGSGSYSSGVAATSVGFQEPYETAFDSRGDMLLSDSYGGYIYLIAAHDCASSCPDGLSSMTAGGLYVVAGNGSVNYGAVPSDVAATSAGLGFPAGVTVDRSGNVLFTNEIDSSIELVAARTCSTNCAYGLASTTAGNIYALNQFASLSAPLQGLNSPDDVAVDAVGDLLVSDYASQIPMLAGANCSADCPYGLASMTAGDVYLVAGSGSYGNAGSGVKASTADIGYQGQLAVGAYDLYAVDTGYDVLREVTGAAATVKLVVSGRGTIAGGGTTCTSSCTAVHATIAKLPLTATPASGRLLAGWIGGECKGAGSCSAFVSQNARIEAVFSTRAKLAGALSAILKRVSGKNAQPKALVKHHGYTVSFTSAAAGKLVVSWHHGKTLVATGTATAAQVGEHLALQVKLTHAGAKLFAGGHALTISQSAKLTLSKHLSITTKHSSKL